MEQQRWQHIYLARLADQAKRYDDVVEEMKKIARMDVQLTLEERNLLSLGYKNVTGSKRVSWHLFSSSVEKEAAKGHEQNLKKMEDYRHKVEDELTRICEDVLSLVDDHLLPSSSTPESTVFFYKMKGDHCRYLAEIKVGNDRKEATDQSLKAYEAGTRIATSNLPPTHQVRLGLALNFSVFYYDILESPERACLMAREAFDEAIPELDSLNEESYKDSTHVLQLIRDNLTLWTPEEGDGSSKLAGEQS